MPPWGGNNQYAQASRSNSNSNSNYQNRFNQNYANQNQFNQNQFNQNQRGQNPYPYRQNMPSGGQQRQPSQRQSPQGQFPQGQFPQGQFLQGQLSQSQFPQGQNAQGQFPPGQFPQGQFSPGQPSRGNLPDGVRMEPIDEKTLKELQGALGGSGGKIGIGEDDGVKSEISESGKTEVIYDRDLKEAADSLGRFIQNERNATIFYRHLSGLAQSENHKKVLEEIGQDSQNRNRILNEIYKKHNGNDFDIKNSTINTRVDFHNGVELAILEESKALKELSRVYERVNDEKTSRILNSILYGKVSDLSMLHFIRRNDRN